MACPYANVDYDAIASEETLKLIFGAMKNAEIGELAYPSRKFVERVENVFMNVVKDSVRLPSITAVFDDEAIDAYWSDEKMICTFYDDIDDLKAYASFRFIDRSSDNFECELDDPNLNDAFKTFLKSRLDVVSNSQLISNAFNYLKRETGHPTYLHPSSEFVERIKKVFVECVKEMSMCPYASDSGGYDTAIIVQFDSVMCFFYEETEDTPARWSFRRIDSPFHTEGHLDDPSFIDTFKSLLVLHLHKKL